MDECHYALLIRDIRPMKLNFRQLLHRGDPAILQACSKSGYWVVSEAVNSQKFAGLWLDLRHHGGSLRDVMIRQYGH